MESAEILQQIAGQVAVCEKCNLHFSRKNAVPGEGPVDAEIMFIGEGPGFYENEQGRPFVGQAGKFLEELLASIHLKREAVFICNVVKCRPPGNRDPLPDELAACSDYLDRQVEAIQPRLIVTLGRYSMARYLPNAKISDVHGQATWVRGRLVVPMFHPAAALHQPSLKPQVQKDFLRLPEFIQQATKAPKIQPERPAPVIQAPITRQLAQFDLLGQAHPLPPAPEEPTPPLETPDEAQNNKPEEPTQLTLF